MKQQTAVEWFFRWLEDNQESTIKEYVKAFEQAKEMEKKQIEEAVCYDAFMDDIKSNGETYYNRIYNSNE